MGHDAQILVASLGQANQIYSFASATYSICMRVGGHYSLFTTSECYLHPANLWLYGHKSGHVTAWKAIMTVDVAGLRGSGC